MFLCVRIHDHAQIVPTALVDPFVQSLSKLPRPNIVDFRDRIFSRIFGIHLHSSSSAVRALTRPAKLDSFDPLPQVLQFSLRCRPWGRGGEGGGRVATLVGRRSNLEQNKRLVVVVVLVVVLVVVVVVVVVRTLCLYDLSVHATQLLAMNSGGRSPGSRNSRRPRHPFPAPMAGVNPGPVPVHRALPTRRPSHQGHRSPCQ